MSRRIELGQKLKEILGSSNVYFQPPDNLKMSYPCIRYRLEGGNTEYADNIPYRFSRQYELILICKDPDSEVIDKLAMLPGCRMDRSYTADNLNHYIYYIYY